MTGDKLGNLDKSLRGRKRKFGDCGRDFWTGCIFAEMKNIAQSIE